MPWNEDQLYRRFLARDHADDGKFLTGVLTTGIYCLPSCPARRPKRENVRFFRTPDEARKNGLRPCHRCHPDSFYRGEEWHENLFEQTVRCLYTRPQAFNDIQDIAATAGLSRTALNNVFRDHAHESPAAFLRRVKVEHACKRLELGDKPIDAAAVAGFESASAFHQQFVARTGLTPRSYAALDTTNEFILRLPPRFRSQEVLSFFGRDLQAASERVGRSGFSKILLIDGRPLLFEAQFENGLARCRFDSGNAFEVHRAAIRMLGFDADAAAFERHFGNDDVLGPVFTRQRGLRIPLTPNTWEAIAWAIIGQQISLHAAIALRRELIMAMGMTHASGMRSHPGPEQVARLDVADLRRLKFSTSKAEYLIAMARSVVSGQIPIRDYRGLSVRRISRLLRHVRGAGPWTVEYALLRGFGFADCLPVADAGLAQACERFSGARLTEAEIRQQMARFAPYRSLAACHLWASLKEKN